MRTGPTRTLKQAMEPADEMLHSPQSYGPT